MGPAFGVCQRQRVSPRHIRNPLLQFAAPPGRSKEPGAETAPPAKKPEPQPPPAAASLPRDGGPPPRSLIRNLPEPAEMAGGAEIGWEQDISALEEHLQWPEWDPESPRGLWTRMTPNDHTRPGSHLPARRPECSLNAES